MLVSDSVSRDNSLVAIPVFNTFDVLDVEEPELVSDSIHMQNESTKFYDEDSTIMHLSISDESVICVTPILLPTIPTGGGPSTRKLGQWDLTLHSPKNISKNKQKILSALDTKSKDSITTEGPKVFKVMKGLGQGKQMDVPVTVEDPATEQMINTIALLDSGSTGSCMSWRSVKKCGLEVYDFDVPIDVYNAKRSTNSGGQITSYARLSIIIGNHQETMMFLVTDLGKGNMFLGFEWVEHHNPSIDWKQKLIMFNQCPHNCARIRTIDNYDKVYMLNTNTWLQSKNRHHARAMAMDIEIEQNKSKKAKTFEETVPMQYHNF